MLISEKQFLQHQEYKGKNHPNKLKTPPFMRQIHHCHWNIKKLPPGTSEAQLVIIHGNERGENSPTQ